MLRNHTVSEHLSVSEVLRHSKVDQCDTERAVHCPSFYYYSHYYGAVQIRSLIYPLQQEKAKLAVLIKQI